MLLIKICCGVIDDKCVVDKCVTFEELLMEVLFGNDEFMFSCVIGGDLKDFLLVVDCFEEQESVLYFAEMIMGVHELHKMNYLHRY